MCFLPTRNERIRIRILASHKESWWDNQTMNINVDDAISDPLEFSENQSGFKLGIHIKIYLLYI